MPPSSSEQFLQSPAVFASIPYESTPSLRSRCRILRLLTHGALLRSTWASCARRYQVIKCQTHVVLPDANDTSQQSNPSSCVTSNGTRLDTTTTSSTTQTDLLSLHLKQRVRRNVMQRRPIHDWHFQRGSIRRAVPTHENYATGGTKALFVESQMSKAMIYQCFLYN